MNQAAQHLSRREMLRLSAGVALLAAAGCRTSGAGIPATSGSSGKAAGPLIRRMERCIRLFPAAASELSGGSELSVGAELENNRRTAYCPSSGRVVWNAAVAEPGEHEIYLCCSVPHEGCQVKVQSGPSDVSEELPVTVGFARPEGKFEYHNFERLKLRGTIRLDRGINPVALQMLAGAPAAKVRIRCLELVPKAVATELAGDEEHARAQRANTDWFVRAGYGVKFTWADDTRPLHGALKSYREAVDAFDVKTFCDVMADTGAGYVIFQVNRTSNHCPAPIKTWEEAWPGQTTQRDLIGEVADGLQRKGIRLFLYMAMPGMGQVGDVGVSGDFRLGLGEEAFVERQRAILTEIGLRYGEKLAGYWFDGWTVVAEAYPNIPFDTVLGFCRAGHAGRLATFNSWIFPIVTPWQDYWAGEAHSLREPFTERYLGRGCGRGLQAHALVTISPQWNHNGAGPMKPPQFSADELIAYVRANMNHQAVTTINVGAYQEGVINEEHLAMMGQLRRAVRGA